MLALSYVLIADHPPIIGALELADMERRLLRRIRSIED